MARAQNGKHFSAALSEMGASPRGFTRGRSVVAQLHSGGSRGNLKRGSFVFLVFLTRGGSVIADE
jgi:hypothetical protein